MSTKLLCRDLCFILLFAVYLANADDSKKATKTVDGKVNGTCSCGGFPTPTPERGAQPLLSQTPDLVIKCDDEGEATCKKLCTALATAAKAQGPMLICNRLKNADELKLSAFFKICEKPWTYMQNMTEVRPLCCDHGKVKTCASVANELGMGNCTCGLFNTESRELEPGAEPLVAHNAEPVSCEVEGKSTCKDACAKVPHISFEPQHLCEKLVTGDHLKIAVFYKQCDKPWGNADNHAVTLIPLCCESGHVKACTAVATTHKR